MRWLKFNISGLIVFFTGFSLGFIIDIICGTGGSAKISTRFSLITLIIATPLFLIGIHNGLIKIIPNFNKALLLIFTLILSSLELFMCYVLDFIIAVFIIGPIMIKLGYYVTMP